jgi:hypothetical protein
MQYMNFALSLSLSVCLSLSLQYVHIAGRNNKMSWSHPVGAQVAFCTCPEQIIVISLINNKILQFSLAVRVNF